jgi:hypothetical protein
MFAAECLLFPPIISHFTDIQDQTPCIAKTFSYQFKLKEIDNVTKYEHCKVHVPENTTVVIWQQELEVTNMTVIRETEHRTKMERVNTTKSLLKVSLEDNKSEW